ncbi:MAG: cell division protein FtsI (penicillin-binding protein 3) [Chlamydiales bacterium]|jgi:cell division protein FtsI (penicillin-binding protein 3)
MKSPRSKPSRQDMRLLSIISFAIFGLFSLLIIQFFKVQIKEGKRWAKIAQGQHEFEITEPFKRGRFLSNTSVKLGHPENIQPFVIDVPKFHLHIDPLSIPENFREEIASKLILLLNIRAGDQDEIRGEFSRRSRNRKLMMWLDRETKDLIAEWWNPFASKGKIPRNALFFINDYQRSYPFGKLLGQVLHTIRDAKDPITKEGIPTGGLELQYNNILKGKLGKRKLLRSPRHSLETGNVVVAPEDGADIYLTINHYLQTIAEEEIEKGVKNSRAKSGWAMMMDQHTGEILAMAQYPFYYPQKYQDYYNNPSLIEYTKPKGVTDAYEPASTMKPLTLAICLLANQDLLKEKKEPLFLPNEMIPSDNGHFPGRNRPLADGRVHHYLNMSMALQKSSNIYLGMLIKRLMNNFDPKWYRNTLVEKFGFGELTNIELPAESAGQVPTPGKLHPNGRLEWSLPTPYSLGIGHNIQVNSTQMLRAFATLANGGILVEPTLIRKIIQPRSNGTQEILLDNTRQERIMNFPRVLDKKIVEEVLKAMKFVTKFGGTAPKGNISGYTEAGKTGTAKKIVNGVYSNNHYFSTFIGFTPAANPRFTLLVAIDEPEAIFIPGIGKNYQGGQCAAPVFSNIARRSLEYLGITPDDPYGYPHGDPRRDSSKSDWAMEVTELKNTYDQWNVKQ